jgi:pimeloyl-ACP methyl ester carboxylesterase
MEKVISKDGTPIAYQRSGKGAPLVLIHGTGASSERWKPILPALEKHFSVYAVDRRGRGASGDAHTYAIQREFEDVAAVVDSIGDGVHLLGHSFGAICSLETTLLTSRLHKVILYEPPIPVEGVPTYPEGIIDQLQAFLDAGDRERALLRPSCAKWSGCRRANSNSSKRRRHFRPGWLPPTRFRANCAQSSNTDSRRRVSRPLARQHCCCSAATAQPFSRRVSRPYTPRCRTVESRCYLGSSTSPWTLRPTCLCVRCQPSSASGRNIAI